MSGGESQLEPGLPPFDNRYELIQPLGQGGMATIYLVRHLALQSLHALKVLNPEFAHSAEVRERFLTEGRIQARLKHPHIVQVTDIVVSPVGGLVMEYVEGETLRELCARSPGARLEPSVLLELFLPVLEAMEEAHRHQVVHRDLNPDNILIGKARGGRLHPMVTDFGIAKVLNEVPGHPWRTRAGALMGTRPYMSPEQIRGAAEVDARTDVFALGALLYEAATGRVAFEADNEFEMMKRITEGRFAPPEQVVGDLPEGLIHCIHTALAVDPALRFQDCAAFRVALQEALAPRPQLVVAPPLSAPAPALVVAPMASRAPQRARSPSSTLPALLSVATVTAALLAAAWLSAVQEIDRLEALSDSLQKNNQRKEQTVQSLATMLEEAERKVAEADLRAQGLQESSQATEQSIQQLTQRLAEAERRALAAEEGVRIERALREGLAVYRVARVCNGTGHDQPYRIKNEDGSWLEAELRPGDCRVYWRERMDVIISYDSNLAEGFQEVVQRLESKLAIGQEPTGEEEPKTRLNMFELISSSEVAVRAGPEE